MPEATSRGASSTVAIRPRAIAAFLLKRLAFAVLVVLVATTLVFLLLDLAPGSPEETIGFGDQKMMSAETRAALREELGLNHSFLHRYGTFLADTARLRFGESFRTQEPVTSMVGDRLGVTAPLVVMALVLAAALGAGLGTFAAYRRGRPADRAAQTFAFVCLSTPVFVLGLVLLYVFAVSLGWFPVIGDGEPGVDRLHHLVLPAVSLGLIYTAVMLKMTRAAVAPVLDADHVTCARARGLAPRRILGLDVLRPAAVGIVAACSVVAIDLTASVVLVEPVFGINGIGSLLTTSIQRQDIPVVQVITLVMALFVIAVTLLSDLVSYLVDPRIRVGGAW